MNVTPQKNNVFNDTRCTGADKSAVSELGKRIFFVTGEPGCGKSTFLAALMKKYAIRSSGFITKKESSAEPALYMHPIVNGTALYRYTIGNRVGLCRSSKSVGFAPVFDAFGVMCLKQAEEAVLSSLDIGRTETLQQSLLPVILMDELGVMEAEAEFFFRTVCDLLSNSRYYIIGVVKPRGTRFLPILEQMPEAVVFHLTLQNRPALYAQLEQAQSFAVFLDAVSAESSNGKK